MIRSVEVRTEATLHKPAEKNTFESGNSIVVKLLIDYFHLLISLTFINNRKSRGKLLGILSYETMGISDK